MSSSAFFYKPKTNYNGNISSLQWNTVSDTLRGYKYQYDQLNRLTRADYAEGASFSTNAGLFSVEIPKYDKNGNILELKRRYRKTNAYVDDLIYSIPNSSNQIQSISDAGNNSAAIQDYKRNSPKAYAYDENGNMIFDPAQNADISYNGLNLPESLKGAAHLLINYQYDAAGNKLVHLVKNDFDDSFNKRTDYVGNLIFEENKLAFVLHSEGRLIPEEIDGKKKWRYEYNIKDHLGNTRAVVAGSFLGGKIDLVQQSHYYPFGLSFKTNNYTSVDNRFLYNGKELQKENGWFDYGARMYNPAIGRWNGLDMKSEKYESWSQYIYCLNNPVIIVDKNGEDGVIVISGTNTSTANEEGSYKSSRRKDPNYKLYNMSIYNNTNVLFYKHKSKDYSLKPDGSMWVGRDAYLESKKESRSAKRYGESNELPPGTYYLEYSKEGFGSKKKHRRHHLRLSSVKGTGVILGPDGKRYSVDLHEWNVFDCNGCISFCTSGPTKNNPDNEPGLNNLLDMMPGIANGETVWVIVEERYASYNPFSNSWEHADSEEEADEYSKAAQKAFNEMANRKRLTIPE